MQSDEEELHAALSAPCSADELVGILRRLGRDARVNVETVNGAFGPLRVDLVEVPVDDSGAGWVVRKAHRHGGSWSALWRDAAADLVSVAGVPGLLRGRDLARTLAPSRGPA